MFTQQTCRIRPSSFVAIANAPIPPHRHPLLLCLRIASGACSKDELEAIVQQQEDAHDDTGELEDGDLVARGGHARETAGGALERRGHGGEGFILRGKEEDRLAWLVDRRRGDGERLVGREAEGEEEATYGIVDDVLGSGIVVDVDGYAAQGGDLGGELVEAGIVLPLALIGFRHGGLSGGCGVRFGRARGRRRLRRCLQSLRGSSCVRGRSRQGTANGRRLRQLVDVVVGFCGQRPGRIECDTKGAWFGGRTGPRRCMYVPNAAALGGSAVWGRRVRRYQGTDGTASVMEVCPAL
jgi:hypothetical protein